MRYRGKVRALALIMAACTVLSGCSKAADGKPAIPAERRETGDGSDMQSADSAESSEEALDEYEGLKEGETGGPGESGQEMTPPSSGLQPEESEKAPDGAPDSEGGMNSGEEEDFVQQKIVIATDLHYLAEDLAGNRCPAFMTMTKNGDGRVLQYGWEILDAFLDDMVEEKPDLVILSGDLTLNGERKSHEELAEKLEVLLEHDIEVAVIPGNHDINNPQARRFHGNSSEKTESITPKELPGFTRTAAMWRQTAGILPP